MKKEHMMLKRTFLLIGAYTVFFLLIAGCSPKENLTGSASIAGGGEQTYIYREIISGLNESMADDAEKTKNLVTGFR